MSIHIKGKTVTITTRRLSAVFDGPDLVELRGPQGQVLARQGAKRVPALALGFANGEKTPSPRSSTPRRC